DVPYGHFRSERFVMKHTIAVNLHFCERHYLMLSEAGCQRVLGRCKDELVFLQTPLYHNSTSQIQDIMTPILWTRNG
ncbi:hypothetical protein ABVT39_007891, partial [Epinephelus coioides]